MNCECNNNSNRVKPRIKHVYGNVLRMAIPLTLRTLVKDGDEMIVNDTDFIPSSDHLVRVVFSKGKTNYPITATMDGNVAIIEDKGKIPVGTYDISVECYDDLGNPYRFKQNAVLYVTDTTAEAGIDEEIEYEAQTWYLNAAVFLATTEIGEIGDVIDAKLDDVFGNVLYDANAKEIRFYNKGNSRVLATIDSRPFVVDGTVADVYIDVSRQVLVVVLNEDAGGRRFSVPLYLVFNSYYKKDEVDSRISSSLENYYTKAQTDTMVSRITPYEVTFTTGNNSNIVCDHTIANIYQNYTNHKPIIAKYGESVGTLVYIKGGENPEAAFLFGDRFDSPYLLRNGVSGWGKEELGADIEVEPWPSIESDKPVASDGVAAALAQKISSVTINGTTKTPDEDGDVSFTVEGGSGGYEPPVGGIPKSDLAQSVQDTLDDVSNKVDKVAGKGLSTNDYTTAEKNKLAGLENYDDSALQTAIDGKVDKETGKSLMSDAEHTKLAGIAAGAEVNVQANWTQTNTSADDYIKNKPTKVSDFTNDSGFTSNAGTITGITMNGASKGTSGVVNLGTVITAHQDISGKANASDVYTKTQTDTLLAGKQNTLTFDDVPTVGSNNPVKSGGIKTAIDQVTPTIDENGKWVIGGVATDKDAQGPRGNTTLVNENAQGIQALIVNNVSDGGEDEILSAEMGKVIRQNIMRIFNALGTYAFPEGKPILSWGSTVIKHSINVNGVTGGLTITDVEVDGVSAASLPAQIVDGKSLSLKLNLPTGMYVFDGVAITMGGVTITNTTGVWDESTGTIYIASVTGDISITAAAVLDPINNYAEQSHLVFQLDGLHKGPTSGKWTDLKGGVVWDNHGATELSDCWQFDGSSYLDSQNMVAHEPRTCTIEVVIDSGLTNHHYFVFTDGSKMVLYYYNNYLNQDIWASRGHNNSDGYGGITTFHSTSPDNGNGKKIVSVTGKNKDTVGGKVNGVSRNAVDTYYSAGPKAIIGGRWYATNNELRMQFTGKVYAIRIYDTILTEAQILANQRLDNQRFNLGLTI